MVVSADLRTTGLTALPVQVRVGGLRIGDRFERQGCGFEVARGDRDGEVVVSADSDPAAGWCAEFEERLRGPVDRDQLLGRAGVEGSGVTIASACREPELGCGIGEPVGKWPVVVVVNPPLERVLELGAARCCDAD